MKNRLTFLLLIMSALVLHSQVPESFSFQAIIRNSSGNPLASKDVSFRFNILKGEIAGISVYEEKQNITTDSYGTVKLAIGNGFDKVGTFETIDWGTDIYFLKVELDTTGGLDFTDMGTSQFLSVPYSLFSKAAGNGFSGNYDDLINKPVTDGSETRISPGNNIIITGSGTALSPYIIINGFSGSYNDLTNKPITDGSETKIVAGVNIILSGKGRINDPYIINSETKVTAGDNIIVSGTGTNNDPYIINEQIHYVGESYGGGIVFYVYDGGRHGLIAASSDLDPSIEWFNGIRRYTNTTGDGLGAGEMNTSLIIALQTNDNPVGNFAAKICADYSVSRDGITYGDWYLPSKYELALLFIQKNIVGGFLSNYYWSSTEFSSVSAWVQSFSDGVQYNLNKSMPYCVRAIRSF